MLFFIKEIIIKYFLLKSCDFKSQYLLYFISNHITNYTEQDHISHLRDIYSFVLIPSSSHLRSNYGPILSNL